MKVIEPVSPSLKDKKGKKEKKPVKCIPIKVWDGLTMESVEVTPRKLAGFSTVNENSS
tara:strand:+ start:264 stop:437 length:174 start_codon:yes stop_codon:yes gene_type:complete